MSKQQDHILIGKIIRNIYVSSDKKAIKILLDDGGSVAIVTQAGGHSFTWIEHVRSIMLPAVVVSVDSVESDNIDSDDKQVLLCYRLDINTNNGSIIVDYRNSSDGPYKGYLVPPGSCIYIFLLPENDNRWDWQELNVGI